MQDENVEPREERLFRSPNHFPFLRRTGLNPSQALIKKAAGGALQRCFRLMSSGLSGELSPGHEAV